MRTSALVRATTALAAALIGISLLAGPSAADEPPLPVVVPETVTLYPGQTTQLNVLVNDSSPVGDDLALCRFPDLDFLSVEKLPPVQVMQIPPLLDGKVGDILVGTGPRAHGTHVIDYWVCDHTHLVPATLTVVVREVEPVDVRKVPGKPGRLEVTNRNGISIRFWFGHPASMKTDGKVTVPAGATRTVRVRRHAILWVALIGGLTGKAGMLSSPGVADHGVVRDIKLDGKPLPKPKDPDIGDIGDIFGRWR